MIWGVGFRVQGVGFMMSDSGFGFREGLFLGEKGTWTVRTVPLLHADPFPGADLALRQAFAHGPLCGPDGACLEIDRFRKLISSSRDEQHTSFFNPGQPGSM